MNKRISRRSFLKSTAVGASGLLAVTLADRTSFPRVVRAAQKRTDILGVAANFFHVPDSPMIWAPRGP